MITTRLQNNGLRFAAVLAAGLFFGCSGSDRKESKATGSQPSAEHAKSSVERGEYLATAVALCAFCHSEVDWKAEGFPPKAGMVGAGRAPFSPTFPWLASPNITPDRETGAGTWTDAQLERALRQGIGHDDRILHPLMPYHEFHQMSDQDATSILLFLRSMKAVNNFLPPTQVPAEMRPQLAALPPVTGVQAPEPGATADYGKYLSRMALCADCHTPRDQKGTPMPGMDFAGGPLLKGPWGEVAALNITPDATGLGDTTEKIFIAAMKTGHLPGGARLNAIMPWGYYGHMTDRDLKAIFLYVKSLKGVQHVVDNMTPPTPCKKCGGIHGQGVNNGG